MLEELGIVMDFVEDLGVVMDLEDDRECSLSEK